MRLALRPLGEAILTAGPAAVVLDQAVTVAVQADGSVAEHTRIAVRF